MSKVYVMLVKLFSLVFFPLYLCVFSVPSFADENSSKKTKAEIKARLRDNVKKDDFGNVVIKMLLNDDLKGVKEKNNVPKEVKILLAYVNPDFDFKKISEYATKAATLNGRELKKGRKYATINGVDKYLSSQSMGIKSIRFSPVAVSQKIDEGLPLFTMLYRTTARDEIMKRAQERSNFDNPEQWAKKLRSLEQKKFVNDSNNSICYGLIMGYNKQTGEFLVSIDDRPYWFTGNEIKGLCYGLYAFRL